MEIEWGGTSRTDYVASLERFLWVPNRVNQGLIINDPYL